MDFAVGILGNLIASVISFSIGLLLGRVLVPRIARARSLVRRLLNTNARDSRPILLTHGYVAPGSSTNLRPVYSIEQGDLRAIVHAHETLRHASHNREIHVVDSRVALGVLQSYKSMISISGPKWNSVTERLLGKLGCPAVFRFTPKGISITDQSGNDIEFLATTLDSTELPISCHGTITYGTVQLPDGAMQAAIVCAGRTTLSTQGAVIYLQMLERSKHKRHELRERLGLPFYRGLGHRKWCAVVKVSRSSSHAGNLALDETDIEIELVRAFPEERFRAPYRLPSYISSTV